MASYDKRIEQIELELGKEHYRFDYGFSPVARVIIMVLAGFLFFISLPPILLCPFMPFIDPQGSPPFTVCIFGSLCGLWICYIVRGVLHGTVYAVPVLSIHEKGFSGKTDGKVFAFPFEKITWQIERIPLPLFIKPSENTFLCILGAPFRFLTNVVGLVSNPIYLIALSSGATKPVLRIEPLDRLHDSAIEMTLSEDQAAFLIELSQE
ncbi:MAG: hypothetical protein Q4G59_04485 [Planctomycetia bacterium]|nr:hypothetical protein [Planctomycetia bacterium]